MSTRDTPSEISMNLLINLWKILTNENLGNIKIAQNRCFVSGLVCQFIRDETPSFTIPGTYVPNNL